MQTLSAKDAKYGFGQLINLARATLGEMLHSDGEGHGGPEAFLAEPECRRSERKRCAVS